MNMSSSNSEVGPCAFLCTHHQFGLIVDLSLSAYHPYNVLEIILEFKHSHGCFML